MKLTDFGKLFKFRYHVTFILVIIGAFLFTSQVTIELLGRLLLAYISFNVLMYGGLYTLNDIADIESDRNHPVKKNRPLASGKVSVSFAYPFAFFSIAAGLFIGYLFFGMAVFWLYVLFILVNQFYTRVAKKIPYLEILTNSLTYPMRLFLGVLLVTGHVPYGFLLAIFLLAVGVATNRRIIEMSSPGSAARKVLKHYTKNILVWLVVVAFCLLLLTAALDYNNYGPFHIWVIAIYVISVFGLFVSKSVWSFYSWLWLN